MITKFFKRTILVLVIFVLVLISGCLFLQWNSQKKQHEYADSYAPKTGSFIEVDDESVFIQENGKKKKFGYVFIHGTGSWSELWQPLMKKLEAKGLYSVAIDMSPFGFSYSESMIENLFDREAQAKKIVKIIKKLGLNNVHLVGHSFGGRATLTAALMIPEKVKGLTLVNVALGFGPDPLTPPTTTSPMVKTIIGNDFIRDTIVAIGTMPTLTRKLVSSFVADEASLTPQIVSMYKKPLRIKGKNAQISSWLKAFLLSTDNGLLENRKDFSKLTCPVVIAWGDLDTVTPLWQGEEIQKLFPGSKLFVLKNVGHIPMIENAQEFDKHFLSLIK